MPAKDINRDEASFMLFEFCKVKRRGTTSTKTDVKLALGAPTSEESAPASYAAAVHLLKPPPVAVCGAAGAAPVQGASLVAVTGGVMVGGWEGKKAYLSEDNTFVYPIRSGTGGKVIPGSETQTVLSLC